jgi:hypothetical protein
LRRGVKTTGDSSLPVLKPVMMKLFTGPAARGMGCAYERETGALTGLDFPRGGGAARHRCGGRAVLCVMGLVDGFSRGEALRCGLVKASISPVLRNVLVLQPQFVILMV